MLLLLLQLLVKTRLSNIFKQLLLATSLATAKLTTTAIEADLETFQHQIHHGETSRPYVFLACNATFCFQQ